MQTKKILKKIATNFNLRNVSLLLFAFVFSFAFFSQAKAVTTYVPMEKIPGFDTGTDFYSYITAVYNFGIWTVGISALLMISIGGFMYITAAGNSSSMGKAKGVITDALFGLVLALISYLLLYIINPDLVNIKKISNAPGSIGSVPSQSYTGAPVSGGKLAVGCDNYKADFESAAGGDKVDKVKKCLLIAIANAESTCNPNSEGPKNDNGTWDCGLMQKNVSNATDCAAAKSDVAGAIAGAMSLLSSNSGNLPAGTGSGFGLSDSVDEYGYNTGNDDLIASYNGGTGTTGDGPFNASVDCPGKFKWNCPINPQGFVKTQPYVKQVQSLQKQCLNAS
jgi:hypothetical protein